MERHGEHARRHVAHFYATPKERDEKVVEWIVPALAGGGGAMLVCTPANAASVRAGVAERGLDVVALERDGRLLILRARDLMHRFMEPDGPNGDRFRPLVGDLLTKLRVGCARGAPIRVWGEMVHLLWDGGQPAAALRLETLWNEALPPRGVELLCSYDVSAADPAAREALRADVLATHTLLAA